MQARPGQASPPRPLVPVAMAVAAGVLAGGCLSGVLVLAGGSAALGAIWAIGRRRALRFGVVLACVAAASAAWAYACRLPARDDIGFQPPGDYVTLTGVVCGDVFPHSRTVVCQLRVLRIEAYGEHPAEASGRVFAYLAAAPGRPVPDYGDALSVHGRLEEPREPSNPGSFDGAAYARRNGVTRTIQTRASSDWGFAEGPSTDLDLLPRLAAGVRAAFMVALRRALPSPRADLVGGIVLGAVAGLPDALKDDFIATGTAHVLAASGYNVAVIALIVLPLGRRLGLSRRPACILTLATVAAYVLVAGAKPSVLRAGVMAALFLGGELLDREADAANVLAASAICLLLADPSAILDVGFQLSFAIVAAIIAGSPILGACVSSTSERARRLRLPAFLDGAAALVASALATTVLAQLAVLPLMAQQFNQVPIAGLIANVLILPLVGMLTALGLALGLGCMVWTGIGSLVSPLVGFSATLMLGVVRVCSELPYASVPTPSPGWPLVAVYGVAFWAALLWGRGKVRVGASREWRTW